MEPDHKMAQTLEPAYTTNVRVLAIEEFGKQGNRTFVKATVEDREDEGFVVECSCTYSLDGFRLLDGAEAALKAFQEKTTDDEEDEEDGTFSNCLDSVLSYITSCFISIIPAKRSNRVDDVLQCKPGTLDTRLPASRKDDVEKHPQFRPEEPILRPACTLLLFNSTMLALLVILKADLV